MEGFPKPAPVVEKKSESELEKSGLQAKIVALDAKIKKANEEIGLDVDSMPEGPWVDSETGMTMNDLVLERARVRLDLENLEVKKV